MGVNLIAGERLRRGLLASFYALSGALVGGLLMYIWDTNDPTTARETVELLPAINSAMSERVYGELREQGGQALLWGPLSGTPCKARFRHRVRALAWSPSFWSRSRLG